MPRFFFHVRDGDDDVDHQGTELADVDMARREAVRFAGALLVDGPERFWAAPEWTVRVTDAADLTVFQLLFVATDGAVAARPAFQRA